MPTDVDLWLPGEEISSEEYALAEAAQDFEMVARFRASLKEIDERLDVVWAKPGAQGFPKPGYWYIVRLNDAPFPPTLWCVEDAEGGYAIPSEADLEALKLADTYTKRDAYTELVERREREQRRRDKRDADRRDEREGQISEIVSHHLDTRISVPRDIDEAI